MTPRERQTSSKESLRREILDAARELFVAEGYESVSMRKIAQKIGYTPMSIYLYFRDKADILDCICEGTFDCLKESSQKLDSITAPLERVLAGLRNFMEFGLEHPHHYQLTFMTPQTAEKTPPASRRRQIGEEAYQRMRDRVATCLGEGWDPIAVDVKSQLIWAVAHGVVSLLIAKPDFPWRERQTLIDGALDIARRELTCPPSA
jgi:AcrR family transcriptional regulator